MTDTNCTVCRRNGARWVMRVDHDTHPVHKPCGERAAAQAPEGTTVKVCPSQALRKQWEQERCERDAQNFWKDKFQEAGLKAGNSGGP